MTARRRGKWTRSTPIPLTVIRPASRLADQAADQRRQLVGHGADPAGLRALDHHARERLRPGVAHEDPPGAVHFLLEVTHAPADRTERLDGRLRLDPHVAQHLRELAQAARERREA